MDTEKDIDRHLSFPKRGEEFPTSDLAKAAAQSIAIDDAVTMLRND